MSLRGHRAVLALGSMNGNRDLAHGLCVQRAQGPRGHSSCRPPPSGARGIRPAAGRRDRHHASTSIPTITRRTCWCGRTARSTCPSSARCRRPASLRLSSRRRSSKRSSTSLRDPKVAVNVRTMNPTRIFVGGEVFKPGFVNYTPGLTAVQAVMPGGWVEGHRRSAGSRPAPEDQRALERVPALQDQPGQGRGAGGHQGRHRSRALRRARVPEDGHREGQPLGAAVGHQHDPDPHLREPVLMSAAPPRRS